MPTQDALAAIREIEQKLTTAELQSDAKTLRTLLTDNFFGVNLRGQRIDKETFIASLCASGIKFESLQIDQLEIRLAGETAITVGKSFYTVVSGASIRSGTAHFMDVWTKTGGAWRLLSSFVTPILS